MQTILTHYTTKCALENILQADGSMSLQATHIRSFEDYSEGVLPNYAGLLKNVNDKMNFWIDRLVKAQSSPHYDQAREEVNSSFKEALDRISKVNHFVTSFSRETHSEHASNVAMWRLYAENANGVCLVFDAGQLQIFFQDQGAWFCRVEYEQLHKQAWRKAGEHLSENLKSGGLIEGAPELGFSIFKHEIVNHAKRLFDIATHNFQDNVRHKHQAYEFEKEERAIFLNIHPEDKRIALRGGSKIPTPRLNLKLTPEQTKNCLLEIVFGPGVGYLSENGRQRLESQLPFFRAKYRLAPEVKISLSDIPFFSS